VQGKKKVRKKESEEGS